MKPISFRYHRFPADVIRHAVWLFFRFSLSFRDVEELMAARGLTSVVRRSGAGRSSSDLADVIRHAVWLDFRFTLSFRDVEEMLAARGIDVSYETSRCWTKKFGPLRRRILNSRARPSQSPVRSVGRGIGQQTVGTT